MFFFRRRRRRHGRRCCCWLWCHTTVHRSLEAKQYSLNKQWKKPPILYYFEHCEFQKLTQNLCEKLQVTLCNHFYGYVRSASCIARQIQFDLDKKFVAIQCFFFFAATHSVCKEFVWLVQCINGDWYGANTFFECKSVDDDEHMHVCACVCDCWLLHLKAVSAIIWN